MPRTTASAARARPPWPVPPTSAANRVWPSQDRWRAPVESGRTRGSSEPPAKTKTRRPGRHGERHARGHHGPSGNIDRPQLEAMNGAPDEVADAAAQVRDDVRPFAAASDLMT